ncbi:MAG: DUF4372 domain-containing protein [Candidatus Hydrogenedentes bacterium]|nr:DUF4372 domain-containing protein [Candidatus Hydrogenedentota bacterium]
MAFGQLTYRDSLRDIVTYLDAPKPERFHAGIRGTVSRGTLAGTGKVNRHPRIGCRYFPPSSLWKR